jgi:hypothetical protein
MQNNFMLFSDIQKKLSFSPIKTWRLLKQLRDDGRMQEQDDCMFQDRKLYVNVPRFIVELEQLGYANVKSDDITSGGVISSEIKKIVDELNLISSEITEGRIQEEMKSDDFTHDNSKPNFVAEDPLMTSSAQNLKSNDFNNSNNSSNFKSNDFNKISREMLETKNELIETLRGSVKDKKEENAELRKMLSESLQRNDKLTQQITFLSNVLAAPKTENEPPREAKVHDISDFSDDFTDEDDTQDAEKAHQNTAGEDQSNDDHGEEIFSNAEEQSTH